MAKIEIRQVDGEKEYSPKFLLVVAKLMVSEVTN